VGAVLAAVALLWSRESHAQVHWDAAAQVGATKRFLSDRAAGSGDAGFGPVAQLSAHLALLPLVRVGAYVGHEISMGPDDAAARQITFGGLRAKGMAPWVHGRARAWVFAGFGYAGVYGPSYVTESNPPIRIQGASGGFFEVPLGIGASYKVFKPWELCAELGARVGFGHTGALYEAPGPTALVPGVGPQSTVPAGLDRIAIGLTIGVLVDL
jgi:hypothetical protein